jgi:Spy/CpxP family protein refolding chaperone
VTFISPTRRLLLTATLLLACAATARAQGRGGMGGPPPGGFGNHFAGDRGPSPVRAAPPLRTAPQLGLPGRWWDDKKAVRSIGLSTDQQRRMDDIFNTSKPALITALSNLQREQARFAALSPAELQDESKVFAAIDRVAAARTELEKANAHVLLQMRQQLDPQQLATLDQQIASNRDAQE